MGEAQGKKVSPPPLRQGDRGSAVLRPDRAIKRPRGSRARQPPLGEDVANTARARGQAQWAKEQKRWRTKKRSQLSRTKNGARAADTGLSAADTAAVRLKRLEARVGRGRIWRCSIRPAPNRRHDEAGPPLSLAADTPAERGLRRRPLAQ